MKAGQDSDHIKRLELLGGLGAGVLGAGLALMFADWLRPFATPALLLGIVSHGWAMYQKGLLEQEKGGRQPAWAKLAERACWLMLAGLGLSVAYRIFV